MLALGVMVIYISRQHKRFAALTSQNMYDVATHYGRDDSYDISDTTSNSSLEASDSHNIFPSRYGSLQATNSGAVTTSNNSLEASDYASIFPSRYGSPEDYQHSQELFDGILALRETLWSACGHWITYRDLAERCCIEQRDGKPCIVFNCEGMLFDGLGLPECSCKGWLAKKDPTVFHGTKDLYGILASNGIMRASVHWSNTAEGKIGWYHSTNFKTALSYARKVQLGRSFWQPVLQATSKCWNRVRTWGYTKKLCKRYSIHKIYLVK